MPSAPNLRLHGVLCMKPISPQSIRDLTTELQSLGLRLSDPALGVAARRGGAGPSDHKAVTIGDRTLMVPVHTIAAWSSPFVAAPAEEGGANVLMRDGIAVARIAFPKTPRFYALPPLDGVPYPKIAVL